MPRRSVCTAGQGAKFHPALAFPITKEMENVTMERPIDKSKKSNRRCVNCINWPNCRRLPLKHYNDKFYHCDVGDRDMDYWNCCQHFQWNPTKTYVS